MSLRQLLRPRLQKRGLYSISSGRSSRSASSSQTSDDLGKIRSNLRSSAVNVHANANSVVSFSSTSDNECFDDKVKNKCIIPDVTKPVSFSRGHPLLISPSMHNDYLNLQKSHMQMKTSTTRDMSSMADIIPEFAKNYTIWGGTAIIFQTLHAYNVPYWGCMSLTSIAVRTTLFPLVIKGAKTAVRNAKAAPETQFVFSMYVKDHATLKKANAPPSQKLQLLTAMFQSVRGIWKLHKVYPWDTLKSPLMQLPVFMYFSVDIRKLINGGNPELAQELTENGFLWVKDLTEPDPWHGLPVLLGMMLYTTVELSMGKQSLSGEASSKSNLAKHLKDGFQSLAVLMPCITANSPAGIQIYLLTSFTFTLFQSAALRYDPFRALVGLPPKDTPPPEGVYVKEMILYSKLESETYGILDPKRCYNFKPYEQMMTAEEFKQMEEDAEKLKERMAKTKALDGMGVYSIENQPAYEPSPTTRIVTKFDQQMKSMIDKGGNRTIANDSVAEIAPSEDEIMEAANLGERPSPAVKIAPIEKPKEVETNFKKKIFPGYNRKRKNKPNNRRR